MKLSRDDLKGIVKECLVEILSEGLTSTTQALAESRKASLKGETHVAGRQAQNPRAAMADRMSFLPKSATPTQRNLIDRNSINAASHDPIIQEMLADTALRGTQIVEETRMSANDHQVMVESSGDAAAKTMLRSDPADVFGDMSSKWATLAFSEKKVGV